MDSKQTGLMLGCLIDFVRESNHIEGINREPTQIEMDAHVVFLAWRRCTVGALERFVRDVADRPIRSSVGMNVRVGNHLPPPGGPEIVDDLTGILLGVQARKVTPYEAHQEYEHLHPFMDGNGRSGRALWAWQRLREDRDPLVLGFLHCWYYESLDAGERPVSR